MKKVIIVGGGLAGLSVGSYLQMNGYETEIFELGAVPGGLCTSWRRSDYLIDGCIHWLVGCNPKSSMYRIWSELLDVKTLPVKVYEEFASLSADGQTVSLRGDLDRLEQEWIALSPGDRKEISFFVAASKRFALLDFPGQTARKIFTLLPLALHPRKLFTPVEKYAGRFKHPLIRDFLTFSFSGAPLLLLLMNASWFANRNAGYPEGGAKELIGRMVARYQQLGGKLRLGARVEKIITENGKAVGVTLANGESQRAELVISAADGRATLFKMLEGQYMDKRLTQLYTDDKFEPKDGFLYVSLGVARIFNESAKPYQLLKLAEPFHIDSKEIKHLGVTIHNFDPKAAPAGKTVLTLMLPCDAKVWAGLRDKDRVEYGRRKQEIADRVVDELERHLGDIKTKLEMVDVATPATYIRYTGNWNGVPMAWQNPKIYLFRPPKQLKGLDNFYMCGQWTGEPGLPGATGSGRRVAMMVCKQDGKKFVSTEA